MAVVLTGLGFSLFGAAAADTSDLAARKLFYQDNQPEVVFKPVAVAARPQNLTTQKPTQPAVPVKNSRPPQLPPNANMLAAKSKAALQNAIAAYTPDGTPVKPVANLGVRYNIMKVNPETREQTAVPADTVFKKGDCLAVRLAPNRGGFLYVFNQGTSGKWQPLIPSEDLVEEPSTVRAYQVVSLPSEHCFEMDDPAGDERLFVMVTEKPEDIKNIDGMLKKLGKPAGNGPSGAPQRPDAMVVAMNNLSNVIQGMQSQLASRDIKLTKLAAPQSKMELPHTVFYTNAAASNTDTLILEIKLKHN
jgi:hypothetical protein